jgi:hypothetical protein
MKGTAQRPDVAFLALAVAVLAVAVALFVGLRSLPQRTAGKAPAEPAEELASAKPEAEPLKASTRDPFEEAAQGSQPVEAQPGSPEQQLKLVGIVQGDEPLAVIRRANRHYYANVGDRVRGYTVLGIAEDRAILGKGEERLTLVLYEPEEEMEESD